MSEQDFAPGTRVKVSDMDSFPDIGYVVFSDDEGYVIAFKWSDPLIFAEKEDVSFDADPTYWDGTRSKQFGDIVTDAEGNVCLLLDARFDDYAIVTPLGTDDQYRIDKPIPYKKENDVAETPKEAKLPTGVLNVSPRNPSPYHAVHFRGPEDHKAVLELFSLYESYFGDNAVEIYEDMIELRAFYSEDGWCETESVSHGEVVVIRPPLSAGEGEWSMPEVRILGEGVFNEMFKVEGKL